MCALMFQLKEKVSSASEAVIDSGAHASYVHRLVFITCIILNILLRATRQTTLIDYRSLIMLCVAVYVVLYEANDYYNLKMFTLSKNR
jgi:hypothetical protein